MTVVVVAPAAGETDNDDRRRFRRQDSEPGDVSTGTGESTGESGGDDADAGVCADATGENGGEDYELPTAEELSDAFVIAGGIDVTLADGRTLEGVGSGALFGSLLSHAAGYSDSHLVAKSAVDVD